MGILNWILRKTSAAKNLLIWKVTFYFRDKLNIPAQTSADRKLFKQVFQQYAGKKVKVFEWGSGMSTIYYCRYLASIGADYEWHAIDNSQMWIEKVTHLVKRHGLDERVHLHLSVFPAFWELPEWPWKEGDAPKDICGPNVVEYVEYPRKVAGPDGFNVMILDGRFRRRCLDVTTDVLAEKGIVILHDAIRPFYHSPLKNFKFGRFHEVGNFFGSKVKMKTWVGSLDHDPFTESSTD